MPPTTASAQTWQDQRATRCEEAAPARLVLTAYTIVLLAVVFSVVAILVTARASAQHREIGLLKAVGVTPRQITTVFALESAALGLVSVVLGFAIGVVLAPRLAASGAATMLGSPTTAANPWHLLVAGVPRPDDSDWQCGARRPGAVPASACCTRSSPALRHRPPRSRLARLVGRTALPVPLALGLKDLFTRRRRATRLAGAIAVTGAAVVFALSMQANLQARTAGEVSDVPRELPVLVYTLDAVLLLITATTLVAVALLSVRERVRDYGVLKTIGLTPRQIASSLVSAHTALATIAAILSIPRRHPPLHHRLQHRRRKPRRPSHSPLVVAGPGPPGHHPPSNPRHHPPRPPSHPPPHHRIPPLRVDVVPPAALRALLSSRATPPLPPTRGRVLTKSRSKGTFDPGRASCARLPPHTQQAPRPAVEPPCIASDVLPRCDIFPCG